MVKQTAFVIAALVAVTVSISTVSSLSQYLVSSFSAVSDGFLSALASLSSSIPVTRLTIALAFALTIGAAIMVLLNKKGQNKL